MRAKHTALILTAGFLMIPTLSWSQGFGGGGPGAGGPGGMRMQMDPDQLFNFVSKGKDVIRVDELDQFSKQMFDRFATRFGLTGNEITREQFKGAMEKVKQAAASGELGGMNMRASSPDSKPGAMAQAPDGDRRIEEYFNRLDRDGDGMLQYDEMSETLQNERDKYDTNHDGMIDLTEFKAYVAARFGGQDGNKPAAKPGDGEKDPNAPEEKKKPTIIRAGNLPKDFPFAALDTDHDGQIGLYEWKDSGKRIADFLAMDLNNDGFITVEEYYGWRKIQDEANGRSSSDMYARGRGTAPGGGMMAQWGQGRETPGDGAPGGGTGMAMGNWPGRTGGGGFGGFGGNPGGGGFGGNPGGGFGGNPGGGFGGGQGGGRGFGFGGGGGPGAGVAGPGGGGRGFGFGGGAGAAGPGGGGRGFGGGNGFGGGSADGGAAPGRFGGAPGGDTGAGANPGGGRFGGAPGGGDRGQGGPGGGGNRGQRGGFGGGPRNGGNSEDAGGDTGGGRGQRGPRNKNRS